ncbi:MAG: AAA family ATPase [Bacteroidaceae bacterium]|nr:AAA family ATPase [Bacteroidaceae bacterium]
MGNKIIGREYEQGLINQYYESPTSEMVAIYGRRRVGKTYLVKKCFDEKFDFWFTGMYETTRVVQLFQFEKELSRCANRPVGKLKDWYAAFDALRDYLHSLGKKKVVVFLDELPWMDTPKGQFLSAFSYFWNMWSENDTLLKLYCCGSATTWMLDKFVGDKGGLYGRVCRSIYLAPFTLHETELYLREMKELNLGRQQVMQVYMIMGGIPYYLDMLEGNVPLEQSIDHLFFAHRAPLSNEYDFLFRSLFRESQSYRNVISILSQKLSGMTRTELKDSLPNMDGGLLTEVLENLCRCDFLRRYACIGKSQRDIIYQLSDLFSLFHLRFVSSADGQDEHYWSNMRGSAKINTWQGYAFEQVCMHHLPQIKKKLGIGGVATNAYSWTCRPFIDNDGVQWKGGQIDLLLDRADNVINICEMKYGNDAFIIDKDYEEHLRQRASLFVKATGSRKTLQHTFITLYGVRSNSYSGVVSHQITMDDLFAD